MVELPGLLLVGFAVVVAGYLWVMHAIDSATAEYDDRLDRIEDRLDELEADDDS